MDGISIHGTSVSSSDGKSVLKCCVKSMVSRVHTVITLDGIYSHQYTWKPWTL